MPDTVSFRTALPDDATPPIADDAPRQGSTSLREAWHALWRRRRFIAVIEAALLAACILYCLIVPNKYEASASVELRTAPVSSLSLDAQEPFASASILTAPLALETLASVLRSDRLAWRVITDLKLYEQPGFSSRFASRFPGFDPSQPSPAAEEWLLKRFEGSLHVQTVPRTFLVDVRFRSRDAALSAAVVNGLIHAYQEQETDAQVQATAHGSAWLNSQLADLKARVNRDDRHLADYEAQHGIMSTPGVQADGQQGETEHASAFLEIDELSRQMVAVSTDRILSEAEYRAASEGDPELVIAADPRLQAPGANLGTVLLDQIHAHRSDLEQEQAQLSAEHGPSFPRVVEIGRQLEDLDRQKQAEYAKLVERFRSNWQTSVDREQLVRKSLEQATSVGMKLNAAVTEYAMMRNDDNASHNLYLRVLEKSEEAGLAAGVHSSNISVVRPRPPAGQARRARYAALPCHHFFCRSVDCGGCRALARIPVA